MKIESLRASFVVFSTVLVCPASSGRAAEAVSSADAYSHLVYTQMRTNNSGTLRPEFVLHRIDPLSDASSQKSKRRISTSRTVIGTGIHSVADGRLLVAGYMGKASFVDLQTGEASVAAPGPAESLLRSDISGHVIFTMPQMTRVSRYDPVSKSTHVLINGSMQRSTTFATHTHSRIELSPNGNRLATATFAGSAGGLDLTHQFEIHIVDMQQKPLFARLLKCQFAGGNVSTGGGHHVYAPAMHWLDEETLLIAAPPEPSGPNAGVLNHNEWKMELYKVNVKTSVVKRICESPIPGMSSMAQFDPDFWSRSDGQLMIRSRSLGDHRVDLDNGEVVSDRCLSLHFELRGDVHRPSLWAGEEQLAPRVNNWDISVSPDGRQVVWMVPLHTHQYGWTHAEKNCFLYSGESGVVELGAGRFDLANTHTPHPVLYPPVLWLAANNP
jgi:hypothetical protein